MAASLITGRLFFALLAEKKRTQQLIHQPLTWCIRGLNALRITLERIHWIRSPHTLGKPTGQLALPVLPLKVTR
jgi:hypothetical protein